MFGGMLLPALLKAERHVYVKAILEAGADAKLLNVYRRPMDDVSLLGTETVQRTAAAFDVADLNHAPDAILGLLPQPHSPASRLSHECRLM